MAKGYPSERFMRSVLDTAEERIAEATGEQYGLSIDTESGVVSGVRNDGEPRFLCSWTVRPDDTQPLDGYQGDWFEDAIDGVVNSTIETFAMAKKLDDSLRRRVPVQTEDRFETVIVFSSRPDIVLTPPGGVPIDEAARVYRSFRDGAAAIGGRCFTALVEAA